MKTAAASKVLNLPRELEINLFLLTDSSMKVVNVFRQGA